MTASPNSNAGLSTPGWDAITQACSHLYPGQEPRHWGTLLSFALGGPDPLDGVSAYRHDDGMGNLYWHFVSFGMSDLNGNKPSATGMSGWGFEFTFRLKCGPGEVEPPIWAVSLMQNLARYVVKTGNVFIPGDYLPLNGPIALGQKTAIHAAMFAEDPVLKTIKTPSGQLQFRQIVGATMDELAAARGWQTANLLDVMRQTNPLLTTDLARQTILNDPTAARLIEEGTARDGSSSGWILVQELAVTEGTRLIFKRKLTVTIGAMAVRDLQALLRGRIPFGRSFQITGPSCGVTWAPADRFGWQEKSDDKTTNIGLPAAAANVLAAALHPKRGDYSVPAMPDLTIRVVPTKIMDHTGQKVIEVIG